MGQRDELILLLAEPVYRPADRTTHTIPARETILACAGLTVLSVRLPEVGQYFIHNVSVTVESVRPPCGWHGSAG